MNKQGFGLWLSMVVVLGLSFGAMWANNPSLTLESFAIAAICGLVLSFLASIWLSHRRARPIAEMIGVADIWRSGSLEPRIRLRRRDSLGRLGSALDRMAAQLSERIAESQRQEARIRTIVDAMAEAVLVTDSQGQIVMRNAALTRLSGMEVRGMTTAQAIRSAPLHEAVTRAIGGEASEVEMEIRFQDRRRNISAQVAPLPAGAGVVAVLHDVTQMRRADAIRRDFVANASHELRTPLTAIRGFAETLADGALDDSKVAKRFVQSISDNAIRLSELVEDLLALSRAESPDFRPTLRDIGLREAAARALRALESKAIAKNQDLSLSGSDSIEGKIDRRALDQILLNLLDNAIKYTPEGGKIQIQVSKLPTHAEVSVKDTGHGISDAHLTRIFERFYRVDQGRSRAEGGTGLGLSIVRNLAERIGAEIRVESSPGLGSTFTLHIPLPEAEDSDA